MLSSFALQPGIDRSPASSPALSPRSRKAPSRRATRCPSTRPARRTCGRSAACGCRPARTFSPPVGAFTGPSPPGSKARLPAARGPLSFASCSGGSSTFARRFRGLSNENVDPSQIACDQLLIGSRGEAYFIDRTPSGAAGPLPPQSLQAESGAAERLQSRRGPVLRAERLLANWPVATGLARRGRQDASGRQECAHPRCPRSDLPPGDVSAADRAARLRPRASRRGAGVARRPRTASLLRASPRRYGSRPTMNLRGAEETHSAASQGARGWHLATALAARLAAPDAAALSGVSFPSGKQA